MANKNIADTAKNGQAANKNTEKVKTLANATERRKEREEKFRNFRINALMRRCKRYGLDDEKTAKYVEELKKQMDAPKEYYILVSFDSKEYNLMKAAIDKANIKYNILISGTGKERISYGYMSLTGNQEVLAKLREIAPPSAKIMPHAKKLECVIPEEDREVIKKPSNNTAERKVAAKAARKGRMPKSKRYMHHMNKGKMKTLSEIRKASRYVKKHLKKGEKLDVKKVFKVVEERAKGGARTVALQRAKKRSTGSKKASMNLKKAA